PRRRPRAVPLPSQGTHVLLSAPRQDAGVELAVYSPWRVCVVWYFRDGSRLRTTLGNTQVIVIHDESESNSATPEESTQGRGRWKHVRHGESLTSREDDP